MRDLTEDLRVLASRLADAERYLAFDAKVGQLQELETQVADPNLWDDPDRARELTTEYGRINEDVKLLMGLRARLDDAHTLYELAVEEDDESVGQELDALLSALSTDLDALDLRSLFTGEHDELDAVCEVHAGEGGTDAQDWTEMMLRMYLRWAERRGLDVEVDETTEGQEAGMLSATFIVKGRFAYV